MDVQESQGADVIESWDRVFRALSAEPRRQLVVALRDTPPAQQVSLPEAAISPTVPPKPEQLNLALQHNHLPLLEECGFIEWTTEPFRASRGPNFDEAAAVCDALHENAAKIPDSLVVGCRRLEAEREASDD